MFLVICLYCGFFFFVFVHVWYTYRNRMIAGSRGIVGWMLLISLKLEPSFYHCLFIWDGKKMCVFIYSSTKYQVSNHCITFSLYFLILGLKCNRKGLPKIAWETRCWIRSWAVILSLLSDFHQRCLYSSRKSGTFSLKQLMLCMLFVLVMITQGPS